MREEDQPPEAIWLNDDKLNAHFEQVSNRYRSGSGTEAVPDPGGQYEQNELTAHLKKRR